MKNELIALKVYQLDYLSFGELMKRHAEDIAKIPAATITDAPMKTYIAGLAARSVIFDKALLKIMFNEESKKIADADNVRDLSIASFIKAVKVFLTSDVNTEIEAARVLMVVINTYKGLAQFDYEKESNGIDNMIAELESPTYSKHVTTLNLGRYITRIKTSNANFRTLFASRLAGTAAKETLNAKELRKDLSNYYNEFCLYIQAMANASATPAQFIAVLNLLNSARKYYADRLAIRKGIIDAQKKDEIPQVK